MGMKNSKFITGILIIIGVLFVGKVLFPLVAPIQQSPLNSILDVPISKIKLSHAKKIFDQVYDDRTGHYVPATGELIPSDQGLKLVEVFRREGDDSETLFYLGRMLCIHAFHPDSFRTTNENRCREFQEGYSILRRLASAGYVPAMTYLGAVTLENNGGMFDMEFYNEIRLPRVVRGLAGTKNWCNRLHFTEDRREYLLLEMEKDTGVDVEKLREQGNGFSSILDAVHKNVMAPWDNGYGIIYPEAIAFLESAGQAGDPEALEVLSRYFSGLNSRCTKMEFREDKYLVGWLANKYEKMM